MRVGVLIGAAVATAGFGLALGPAGVVVGVVLGGLALVQPPVLAFAVGQVLLGVAGWGSVLALVVTEIGLAGVLLAGDGSGLESRLVGVYALVAGGLAAIVGVSLAVTDNLWVTTGVALAVVTLLSYGVHRYGVLVLWRLDIERVTSGVPRMDRGDQR